MGVSGFEPQRERAYTEQQLQAAGYQRPEWAQDFSADARHRANTSAADGYQQQGYPQQGYQQEYGHGFGEGEFR